MSALGQLQTVTDDVLNGEESVLEENKDIKVISDMVNSNSEPEITAGAENFCNSKIIANGTTCVTESSLDNSIISTDQVTKKDESDSAEAPKLSTSQSKKIREILKALALSDINSLNAAAISEGGLILDRVRQKVWPKLIGVDIHDTSPRPTMDEVENHPYYNQVLLDVNRSLKRFPPSIEEKQRLAMQDQLVLLIMRVLIKHPKFHYYQGYHDICVTFLLVLGEEMSFYVVERLSLTHLSVFMKESMEPTVQMLNYMYPILEQESPTLHQFLEKSEVGVIFALSWLITWFGHVLNNYSDVVRLFDFFMASNRWMPVYLSTAIVFYREEEILNMSCDIASVHSLLSNIPEELPFEKLIIHSMELFITYPPDSLKEIVSKRMEAKKAEMLASRKQQPPKKFGLVKYVCGLVKYVIPNKKMTFSFVLAAAVLFSAVWYQNYKNS